MFNDEEKKSFRAAIEVMVQMGIQIKRAQDDSVEVKYIPDIGHLILFVGEKKINMQSKIQAMIANNYNSVKQAMHAAGEGKPVRKSNFGVLYETQASKLEGLKKRKRSQMDLDRGHAVVEGAFRYKFQQGHTKNVRHQVPFSFFF